MPIITVQLAKGRSSEQKQKFVEMITKEAAQTFDVKEEWVTEIFGEYA
ncbi:4-oxalocrotonate tautomerase family protein [Cytobacillus sp. FJAT-54145]|uniref:4-oxalocrotonate tautomerase family protein n=1 Tax=Cytobacillus spartinae TaxID=3299023 RepID=A0ABW6KHS9_9BACI